MFLTVFKNRKFPILIFNATFLYIFTPIENISSIKPPYFFFIITTTNLLYNFNYFNFTSRNDHSLYPDTKIHSRGCISFPEAIADLVRIGRQPFAIIRHLRGRVCNSNHHLRLWGRHSAQGVASKFPTVQRCPYVSSNRSRDKIKQGSRRLARPVSPWKLADFSVNSVSHPPVDSKSSTLTFALPVTPIWLPSLKINDTFLWIQAAISLITRAKKLFNFCRTRGVAFTDYRPSTRWQTRGILVSISSQETSLD